MLDARIAMSDVQMDAVDAMTQTEVVYVDNSKPAGCIVHGLSQQIAADRGQLARDPGTH